MATSDAPLRSPPTFHDAHALCNAAVDYVLGNVNTVQYLIQSIEGITGRPFTRDRIKCLPAVPLTQQQQQQRRPPPPQQQQQQQQDNNKKPGVGKNALAAPPSAAGGQALTLRPDHVFAGYMWRRARPDCEKGDIVLVEEHLTQASTLSSSQGTDASGGDKKKKKEPMTVKELLEQNYKKTIDQTERNIRHELIHAFDDARGFVESADCRHQACSEIRAARLSGDCFAAEEAKKGRFSMFQGGLQCVRRRATMAVEMNPVCKGFSDRAVETVFQRCYSDYEPFVAPVYALGSYGDDTFENGTLKL